MEWRQLTTKRTLTLLVWTQLKAYSAPKHIYTHTCAHHLSSVGYAAVEHTEFIKRLCLVRLTRICVCVRIHPVDIEVHWTHWHFSKCLRLFWILTVKFSVVSHSSIIDHSSIQVLFSFSFYFIFISSSISICILNCIIPLCILNMLTIFWKYLNGEKKTIFFLNEY